MSYYADAQNFELDLFAQSSVSFDEAGLAWSNKPALNVSWEHWTEEELSSASHANNHPHIPVPYWSNTEACSVAPAQPPDDYFGSSNTLPFTSPSVASSALFPYTSNPYLASSTDMGTSRGSLVHASPDWNHPDRSPHEAQIEELEDRVRRVEETQAALCQIVGMEKRLCQIEMTIHDLQNGFVSVS
jgi:hypothetical protein